MYSSSFPEYSMSTSFHRVSLLTFILYSLNLLHKVTYIFWALTCFVALPSYTALVSSFCTSSQDFDTHFLHFHLTMDSLCFSMWTTMINYRTFWRTLRQSKDLFKVPKIRKMTGLEARNLLSGL